MDYEMTGIKDDCNVFSINFYNKNGYFCNYKILVKLTTANAI